MCIRPENLDAAYVSDMAKARQRLLARLGRDGLVMRLRKLHGADRRGLRAALLAGEVAIEPGMLGKRVGMTAKGYDAWAALGRPTELSQA